MLKPNFSQSMNRLDEIDIVRRSQEFESFKWFRALKCGQRFLVGSILARDFDGIWKCSFLHRLAKLYS